MKKLIFAVLFFSSAAFADQVMVTKTDCSIMGNFKVKVRGLDYGRMGRQYLKADLPYFENCDNTEMVFHQSIGRGATDVKAGIRYTYRKEQSGKGEKVKCKIYEIKTLSMTFNRYRKLKFSRSKERLKTKLKGACPK